MQNAACQAPLFMGLSCQEYWSKLGLPSPEDLPNPGMEHRSPALTGGFFITEPPGKPPGFKHSCTELQSTQPFSWSGKTLKYCSTNIRCNQLSCMNLQSQCMNIKTHHKLIFPGSQILWKILRTNNITISEKAVAPHSSTLAWKTPWTEEPGRLQSMGSLRVGHDWATSLSFFPFMHWRRKWQPTPVFLPGESQGRGSLVGCGLWGRLKWLSSNITIYYSKGSLVAQMVKNLPSMQETLIRSLAREDLLTISLPGEGNGNPLQYSCMENSMDRGAWQAAVHGVAESDMTDQLTHNIHMYKILLF